MGELPSMANDKSPNFCVTNNESLAGSRGGRPLRTLRITQKLYESLVAETTSGYAADYTLMGLHTGPGIKTWYLSTPDPAWFKRWAKREGAEVLDDTEFQERDRLFREKIADEQK